MKKQLLLIILSLFSYGAFSSHLHGGFLTWVETSSGQFIFKVHLVHEGSLNATGENISGPFGQIPLQHVGTVPFTYCADTSSGSQYISETVLESAPVSLQGTPPASGWEFSYSTSVMGTSVVNVMNSGTYQSLVSSRMFTGGKHSSPQWINGIRSVFLNSTNKVTAISASSGTPGDSLFYRFDHPNSFGTPVIYNTGYSAQSPIPSLSTDPSNGPVVLDGQTGLIYYDINMATQGSYHVAIVVEQWKNGQKVSEIEWEYGVPYSPSAGNNAPSFAVSASHSSPVIQVDTMGFEANVTVGDTLNFILSGSDFDILPGTFTPEKIKFQAFGSSLDTSISGAGIPNGAIVSPVSPQQSFVSTLNNNVEFTWGITAAHSLIPEHFFLFSMTDERCGYSYIILKVNIQPTVGVSEYKPSALDIYPNPANESFTVDGLTGKSQIQILDVNGRLISTTSTNEKSVVIERGDLAAGMYFVKISDSNTSSLQKVMFD